MKAKIYILTYKRPRILNLTLNSLFDSDAFSADASDTIEVNIINNHTEFFLEEEFKNKVTVLHNNLRPDFSTGHLSRSWNQALILGFRNLADPDCELVITLQDDVLLHKDWLTKLKKLHFEDNFSFVQNGHGDALCSYTCETVRKVGLWDERFIMGMQAADYFYRHLMYNWDGCTITDPGHQRVHNPTTLSLVSDSFFGLTWSDPALDLSVGSSLMDLKYGSRDNTWPWSNENKTKARSMKFGAPNFIFYPYFEKEVYNLREKGYLI